MKISEAINVPSDYPDFINPDIRRKIEGEPAAKDFGFVPPGTEKQPELHNIASSEYKHAIDNVSKWTGKPVRELNVMGLAGGMMEAIGNIMDIESQHIEELEHLAVQTVINLPMFKKLKDAYENDQLEINVKLGGTISMSGEEEEDTHTPDITEDEELYRLINNLDEKELARRFANTIIQGAGVSHHYLFQMIKPELDKIDPHLINLYGLAVSVAQFGYWSMPFATDGASKGGEENIEIGEDKPTVINAKGIIFPILMHELIKGALEIPAYVGLSQNPEAWKDITAKTDTLGNERLQILLGRDLWKRFQALFTPQEQEYLPVVFQILLSQVEQGEIRDTIRTLFTGGKPARDVIDSLIDIAKSNE